MTTEGVICGSCGAENSQSAKFCIECGADMGGAVCNACGTVNSPATKFCIECGLPIAVAPPAAEADALPPAPAAAPSAPLWAAFTGGRTIDDATLRTAAIALVIFTLAFSGYFLSTRFHPDGTGVRWLDPPPRCCMFYADLANALNHGTLDLTEVGVAPNHPDLFTDVDGEVFLPYQPMPGVLLMPVVAIWGTGHTELTFSMLLGAVNVVLFWYILRLLNISRQTKLLLVPFFAFGTAHFYSATTGSLWFYNHVTAVFFVLLAIVFLLRKDSPILPALCLGAAALSRQPTVLAVPAFLYFMIEQRNPGVFARLDVFGALRSVPEQARVALRKLIEDRRTLASLAVFLAVLIPFGIISLWYNEVRFGSLFDTGLDDIYEKYEGYGYTQYLAAGGTRFAEFDFRNIPIHLYTIFLQPPIYAVNGDPPHAVFRPSEFGMSVLLTSSPLLFGAFVRRSDALKRACWIGILLVSIPTLMYYSAGWVQFGYRYLMDYLPFLMILTAFGFDDHQSPTAFRVKVALVVLSIAIGFWGRYWATRLVW
ncbi:MAG TPA: zinc ribbon domain-containing protein [Dehalococcoidia bacterium]|nr:zinc ribbon domain-containing protein [Dehalococcoidia bacterium]